MSESLDKLCWPVSRISQAMEELALSARLIDRRAEATSESASFSVEEMEAKDSGLVGRFVEASAEWMGLEAEPLSVDYSEIESVLRLGCPMIIRLRKERDSQFLAIASAGKRYLKAIGPAGGTHRIKLETLRDMLCQPYEAELQIDFNQLLEEAGVARRRRAIARDALLSDALGHFPVGECWLLGLPRGASFIKQLQRDRFTQRFCALMSLQLIQYILLIGSWWVIGRGALQGYIDYSWLVAWALMLLTMIPFKLMSTWTQGVIAIKVGGLLKQRLLDGALKSNADMIREEGSGKILGRVIESAAIEALATTGGFAAVTAIVELILSVLILSEGAGGIAHSLIFIGWAAVGVLISWRYFKQRVEWTDIRLLMTNDMVERMVGHRTRLAQESPAHWHDGEDQLLARYIDESRKLDRSSIWLMGLIPRGWLLLGLLGLIPSIISGSASSASLAVSVGGMLLGYASLGRLSGSLSQATGVAIAWQQIKDLFNAAAQNEISPSPAIYGELALSRHQADEKEKIIEAADLVYRYRAGAEPVLRRCGLEIFSGERILLEGPSGEGKSTLAALLVGLRTPDSGLLLLEGFDRRTLGARGWRERVTTSPQFHENHVLTGTLAFNLLMGRDWPPSSMDLEEAETICRELGLSELIERMPSGLSQIVGETGWQLSHGERSRIFIARALLQKSNLIVLDESFAALDPENLRRALECALRRSPTLIVVAHP